jgi:hypothetical protein
VIVAEEVVDVAGAVEDAAPGGIIEGKSSQPFLRVGKLNS